MQYQCMYHHFTLHLHHQKLCLKTQMKSIPNFKELQAEFFKHIRFRKYATVCIDIVNTILSKEEPGDSEFDLESYEKLALDTDAFNRKYILVRNQDQKCCGKEDCFCLSNKTLYMIKPYALNFLRSVNSFYEVIFLAKLPDYEVNEIVSHLETLLNEHIIDIKNNLQKIGAEKASQ